jgi:pimeloyl-ACP methyl ester carboxylesterase
VKHEAHLSQGTIRYREDGTGEPLLFVHGVVVNGDLWRKVLPRLAKDFRCIVPDWPLGSHEVPMSADADLTPPGLARLVVDFMDALGLETVTLVGNDTGGAVCQIVAAEKPDRVARLVLTSCDLYDRFPPPVFKPLAQLVRMPGALWLIGQSLRPRFAQRLPIAFGWVTKRLPEKAIVESYLAPGRSSRGVRRDLAKVFGSVDARYTIEAAQKLESFDKPILLAWAEEDKLFPLEYAQRFTASVPDGTLEVIPDSYTFIPEDQPDRLAEAIASFVRRPAPVSA